MNKRIRREARSRTPIATESPYIIRTRIRTLAPIKGLALVFLPLLYMSETLETVLYRGHEIEIWSDYESCSFYYDDLESGADGQILFKPETRDSKGFGIDRAETFLEAALGKLSSRTIYNRLPDYAREEVKRKAKDYDETIAQHLDAYGIGDYAELIEGSEIEILETICGICKIDCYSFSVRGYCQGDYAELLLIDNGELSNFAEGSKQVAKYVEHVFFTGFCGFTAGNDSCGGYTETKGAIAEGKASIDVMLERERREHEKKTKAYVRNRVPLPSRK